MSIKKDNVMNNEILSPLQSRAARAMLNWSQVELADKARVAKQTIADFETGKRAPYDRTLRDIKKVLENNHIEFLGANGVRILEV
jgi:DNA-binding XRE family transcriptional regulator